MKNISAIAEFQAGRQKLKGTVGFIPTMGCLHEGHLALVKQALAENDYVVVSIFVNPKQFGPQEDLAAYPRTLANDLKLLRSVGCDFVFTPDVSEMYPEGFQTEVRVQEVTKVLEGARRPNHFAGVTTVVCKLFNIVQPARAYFGQKDAQQVAVVKQMVADLAMPLKIVVAPTVRAADGLALSSRNRYLDQQQRAAAPVLYRSLTTAQIAYQKGENSPKALRKILETILAEEPLAEIDYVSVADATTLKELDLSTHQPMLLSMAVRIGKTRLIDNIVLL